MNTYERLDELTDALEERFAHMKELREKLDARLEEDWKEFTEEIKERSEEWKEQSEERKEARKEKAEAYRAEWQQKADGYKDELDALRVKFHVIMEKRFQLLHHKDFFRRDMIRNNPVMVSKQFKEALEDLKRAAREKVDEVKKRE